MKMRAKLSFVVPSQRRVRRPDRRYVMQNEHFEFEAILDEPVMNFIESCMDGEPRAAYMTNVEYLSEEPPTARERLSYPIQIGNLKATITFQNERDLETYLKDYVREIMSEVPCRVGFHLEGIPFRSKGDLR